MGARTRFESSSGLISLLSFPNQSYDGNPLEADEEIFPNESLPEHGYLGPLKYEEALAFLWRAGKVPEWIDVSVQACDTSFRTFSSYAAAGLRLRMNCFITGLKDINLFTSLVRTFLRDGKASNKTGNLTYIGTDTIQSPTHSKSLDASPDASGCFAS
jgi:hypothetical protein